ncbi:hypothetical protein LIS90_13380 [Flavobacterium psychrophilum]|uniref:hypothetical protein n=1 Tax=Flavobacterium psychrophilum TaxID=96345 RepID=UPI000A3D1118|nr:hypothetical protein [Flavobacterium psychrophilum]MCB6232238.1 hypothetical protein [Flavobacterium psychrophilum]OUD24345.1 hypothetical protein FPG92_12815 [Flavobacterium psychrophilum]
MEINLSKNILYNVDVPIGKSKEYYEKWYENVSKFMYSCLENEEVSFLGYYPPDKSIGDDFCPNNYKIKTYSNTFYYYHSAYLSNDNVSLLVKDDEFNLGNIIVIKGSYDKDVIYLLSLCWEKELITANKEIFKMDSDGLSFYWYNPKSNLAENDFKSFANNFENPTS